MATMARPRRLFLMVLTCSLTASMYSIFMYLPKTEKSVRTSRERFHSTYTISEQKPQRKTLSERRLEWHNYTAKFAKEVKAKRLPDIVGIGVKKCGTDAVISFLNVHPFVESPSYLEAFFFMYFSYKRGLNYYRNLMPKAAKNQLIMEKTPAYFDSPPSTLPNRIHNDLPNSKLILVLCDPVKRSFSDYTHERARYKISAANDDVAKYETFDSFLDVYMDRVNATISLKRKALLKKHMAMYRSDHASTLLTTGFYSLHLPRWTKLFNSSRLLILDGEKVLKNPGQQVEKMQEFIGIPKLLLVDDFVKNPVTGLYCIRPWWKNYDFEAEKAKVEGWEKNLKCLVNTKGRTRHKNGKINVTAKHLDELKKLYRPFTNELKSMTDITFDW